MIARTCAIILCAIPSLGLRPYFVAVVNSCKNRSFLLFQVTWDWVILGLTFYTVVMVPFNLAVYRTSYTSTGDITFMVVDSIVDIIFLIDIIFNFHTSFVGSDGAVIVDEAKIRSEFSVSTAN